MTARRLASCEARGRPASKDEESMSEAKRNAKRERCIEMGIVVDAHGLKEQATGM